MPDEVRESATGMGYGAGPAADAVELPLALPVIMAGLRVATVSTVALTTVGSIVAYGGLGNLIKDGVNTNFRAELMTASLLCVLLAVVLDVLLVLHATGADPVDPGGPHMTVFTDAWDYLTDRRELGGRRWDARALLQQLLLSFTALAHRSRGRPAVGALARPPGAGWLPGHQHHQRRDGPCRRSRCWHCW